MRWLRLVRCEDVSVVFGRGDAAVTALRDATIEIGPGETVALAGPSGSGKTTLLHVLGGLVEPTCGTVELAGRPAFVFQEPGLLPSLSALENVAFGTWLARRAGRPPRPAAGGAPGARRARTPRAASPRRALRWRGPARSRRPGARARASPPPVRRADRPARRRHRRPGPRPARGAAGRGGVRAGRLDPRRRHRRAALAAPAARGRAARRDRGERVRSALLLATARTRHAPRRTAVQLLALTVATALLGAMLLFVRASLAAMTASTVGRVPVDWQGAVPSHGAAEQLAALVRRQPGHRPGPARGHGAARRRRPPGPLGRGANGRRRAAGGPDGLALPRRCACCAGRCARARWCSTSSSPPRCRPSRATASRSPSADAARPCACGSAASPCSVRPTPSSPR